jgi:hypothetical protein
MSFKKCSVHGAKIPGRAATLYAAWFRSDGVRTAWKQTLCAPCAKEELSLVIQHAADESSDVTACPACGKDSSDDLDPIYLNLYLPKQNALEYALATCGPCAVTLRARLQVGASKLENRQIGDPDNEDDDSGFGWAEPVKK